MMKTNQLVFDVCLDTNIDSNDYLRCLWTKIRHKFGKFAWLFNPVKIADRNLIMIGDADIDKESPLSISIHYKKKGCISSIIFNSIPDINVRQQLLDCLKQATEYRKYLKSIAFSFKFDSRVNFKQTKGKYFSIEGNNIIFHVNAYDTIDGGVIAKDIFNSLCSILSFYLLYPIHATNQLVYNERNCKRSFVLPEQAAVHIDDFLSKRYEYEDNLSLFETAIESFSQGIIYEDLSYTLAGADLPFVESAIVSYMSALEIISTNDIPPSKCETCGQMRYSIARRVQNLVERLYPGYEKYMSMLIKDYYKIRSSYVHTGKQLSKRNYLGISIPLLSISNRDGMINQKQIVNPSIKYIVRNSMLLHEGRPLIPNED